MSKFKVDAGAVQQACRYPAGEGEQLGESTAQPLDCKESDYTDGRDISVEKPYSGTLFGGSTTRAEFIHVAASRGKGDDKENY